MRGGAHELGSRWVWAHGPIGPDLLARRHGDDPAALRAEMGRLVADLDRASTGDLLATLPLADLADPGRRHVQLALALEPQSQHRRKRHDSAATAVARQRIFHDPDRPSRLTLTVVG